MTWRKWNNGGGYRGSAGGAYWRGWSYGRQGRWNAQGNKNEHTSEVQELIKELRKKNVKDEQPFRATVKEAAAAAAASKEKKDSIDKLKALRRARSALGAEDEEMSTMMDERIKDLQCRIDDCKSLPDKLRYAQQELKQATERVAANQRHLEQAQEHLQRALQRQVQAEDALAHVKELIAASEGSESEGEESDFSVDDDDDTHMHDPRADKELINVMRDALKTNNGLLQAILKKAKETGGPMTIGPEDMKRLEEAVGHGSTASAESVAEDAPMETGGEGNAARRAGPQAFRLNRSRRPPERRRGEEPRSSETGTRTEETQLVLAARA